MKKAIALILALVLAFSLLAGCADTAVQEDETLQQTTTTTEPETTADPAPAETAEPEEPEAPAAPKYVFLFIGDGMSYPQIQSTADYLGALTDTDYWQAEPSLDDNGGAVLDGPSYLNFMNFEAAGSAVTYDSNSFCPDSASTATSISTGHKTYSGTINMDETGTTPYETIAEKVHDQLGMSVGVISSVNLNHATPAAFYAHQASRNDYYEIGLELVESGFEYFAGGGLLKPTGADEDQEDLYALAEQAGYNVVKTQAEAEQVTEGPVIIVDEHLADGDAMAYELDRTEDMWSLADHVAKGIEVLEQDEDRLLHDVRGRQDRLGLPRQRRRLLHPRHPGAGRRGPGGHRLRRGAPRGDPDPGHRRPRDRRSDHRLRRHRLRHLPGPAGGPEDLLRQVRQRLRRRLQGEPDLL